MTATTTDFDFRAVLLDELEEHGHDPRAAFIAACDRVPDHLLRDVLKTWAWSRARTTITGYRDSLAHKVTTTNPRRLEGRSKKQAALDEYQEWLSMPEWIAPGRDVPFGDCTRDDLMAAAQMRREQADANIAEAEKREKLASSMSGKDRVRDLPEDLVREAMR